MKRMNTLWIASLILIGVVFSGCQEEETPLRVKGKISLDLNIDDALSVEGGRLTEVSADTFKVVIYNQADQAVETYDNFSDMPDEVELDTGTYYVVAHSNNEASAAFENPYYYGESSEFQVKEKQVVPIVITCELYNFGISVVYSDYVVANFDSYSTDITNATTTLSYAGDETRIGHFEVAAVTIKATLSYTKSDNSAAVIEVTGSISSPVRKTHYIITIDAQLNGSISPIGITVDETTESISLVLSNGELKADIMVDVEGTFYQTVEIGDQVWMAENLRTRKYNDGSDIPLVTDNTDWDNLTSPAYAWYSNDSATYADPYGALYNWYAVDPGSNGGKNICPTGWHVPTVDEVVILEDLLGGGDVAGGKMKEAGLDHWDSPNTGATNESGLTVLGAGYRAPDGTFVLIRHESSIHVAAPTDTTVSVVGFTRQTASLGFYTGPSKNANTPSENPLEDYGYSVRCVKD